MIVKYPNLFPEDPALKIEFPKEITDNYQNVELHIDVRKFVREPGKKYYCLDFELPNGFVFSETRKDYLKYYEKLYDKIITICPFTVKKRNEELGMELYVYGYFPSSENWNRRNEKDNDIIYVGSGTDWFLDDRILNYKHIVINQHNRKYTTHSNLSFVEKMDLISKSKITLTHNLIDCSHITDQINSEKFYEIKNKKLTQHKSRVIEAARANSLILCKEDEFNIIEDILTPNEDFIYYNDDNFTEIINNVLNNYQDYQYIIDNAHNKVVNNYDIKNFVTQFII
jgi:hypothetical protein